MKRSASPTFSSPLKSLRLSCESTDICDILDHIGSVVEFLPPRDVRALGSTSKKVAAAILAWLLSEKSNNYVFQHFETSSNGHFKLASEDRMLRMSQDNKERCIGHFQELGKLMKVLTATLPVNVRLSHVQDLIARLRVIKPNFLCQAGQERPTKSVNKSECCVESHLTLVEVGSKFAFSVIESWSDNDADNAFDYVLYNADKQFEIRKNLNVLFDPHYTIGENGDMEFRLKFTLLNLFWTHLDANQRPHWIAKLLKSMNPTRKVRNDALILYLMFGPLKTFSYAQSCLVWIKWDEPTEVMEFNSDFKLLAIALSSLYSIGQLKYAVMKALLHKLDGSDDAWCDQCVALLTFFMSKESRQWVFTRKIATEDIIEVSEIPGIIAQLLVVAEHMKTDAKDIYQLISLCYSKTIPDHKANFIESLWHELSTYLLDVSTISNNEEFKEPTQRAISKFGRYLMEKNFLMK